MPMLKQFVFGLLVGLGLSACGEIAAPTATPAPAATTSAPVVAATSGLPATTNPATAASPTFTAGQRVVTHPATVASRPTVAPVPDNGEPITLRFSEFYASGSAGLDLQLSDKLKSADGRRVRIIGYMAPPLKPALDFFVLTRIRMVTCPFCVTSEDWPQDIILVTMPPGKIVEQTEEPLTLVGRLEIGEKVDPQTGFLSLLRIRAETVEVFKGS